MSAATKPGGRGPAPSSRSASPPRRRSDELKFMSVNGCSPKSRSGSRKRTANGEALLESPEPAARRSSSCGSGAAGGAAAVRGGGLVASTAAQGVLKCQFCGMSDDDEQLYGQLLTGHGLVVHYFCMLFSSALSQGGNEEDGIFGFLPGDISKEIRRGKKLKCCYCRHTGATIGCVTKKCRKAFHFGCGKTHGALNQYFGTYSTYCSEHRPQQSAPVVTSNRLSFHGLGMAACPICTNSVETRASNTTLRSPCCTAAGNTWYHRDCIQQMALNSGMHFIRCPLCNDRDRFISEMLEFGIYIPDRDASWEVEAGAYSELHTSHNRCDVQPTCHCPHGREHKGDEGSPWEIFLCMSCGGNGIHLSCYIRSMSSGTGGAVAGRPIPAAAAYGGGRKRDDSPPDVTWNCSDCSAIMIKSGLQCDRALRSMRNRPVPSLLGADSTAACAQDAGDDSHLVGALTSQTGRTGRMGRRGGTKKDGCSSGEECSSAQHDSGVALARHVATSLSLEPPRVVITDVSKRGMPGRGRRGRGNSRGLARAPDAQE